MCVCTHMYVCTSMFACLYVLLKGSNIVDHYRICRDHPLAEIIGIVTWGSTSGILLGLTSKMDLLDDDDPSNYLQPKPRRFPHSLHTTFQFIVSLHSTLNLQYPYILLLVYCVLIFHFQHSFSIGMMRRRDIQARRRNWKKLKIIVAVKRNSKNCTEM